MDTTKLSPPAPSAFARRKPLVRSLAPRLALATVGLIVGLAVAETVLWVADLPHIHKHIIGEINRYSFLLPSGNVHHVNAPNAQNKLIYENNPRGYFGPENEIEHPINSQGFRGDEFPASKPSGAFRILFIGDSFTLGQGVKFSDTFAELVKTNLQASSAAGDRPVECINLGVNSHNTDNEQWCLDKYGWPLDPDLVVLGYVLNDSDLPETWTAPAEANGAYRIQSVGNDIVQQMHELSDANPPDRLIYRLRLAQLIWKYWNDRQGTQKLIDLYHARFDDNFPGWRRSREALQEIADQCHALGIPCIVVMFPVFYDLQNYPFVDIHAKVRDAVGNRALFIDLLPALADKKAEDLWVHPTDQHPNEVVHAIAAQKIAEAITKNGLLAPRGEEAK